ncbi:Adenosine deaminase CECR1-like protein [Diplonema papillatum]|nr:Adenosine deaminase CECR1-like protein [Diplonema papillatum]
MKAVVAACIALACGLRADGLTVDQYMEARGALESKQQRLRFDGDARSLSAAEASANATLVGLVRELRLNSSAALATPLRGEGIRKDIKETRLFRLLHDMPKASLLHVHAPAMNDLAWFVRNGTHRDNCYVYWSNSTATLRKGTAGFFKPGSEPPGYVAAAKLRADVPNFDAELEKRWDVAANETFIDEAVDPWGPFASFFSLTGQVFRYAPVYKDYMRKGLLTAVDQWRLDYLELRGLGYGNNLYDLLNGTWTMHATAETLRQVVEEVKRVRPAFLGAGVIYSQYRRVAQADVMKGVQEAAQLQAEFGADFVLGYDLVGDEDQGEPLRTFVDALVHGKNLGLEYFFHAGETDWAGNGTTGDNVNDAVVFNTRRIGHGLAMAKLPVAAEAAINQSICLEICPVSNQGLQFVLDARDHPAATLLAQGVQLTINNDDPTILGTADSLGWDWWLAVVAWDVDLASVKKLLLNSIDCSAAPAGVKQTLRQVFAQNWAAWVARVNDRSL